MVSFIVIAKCAPVCSAQPAVGTNILSLASGTINISGSLLISRKLSVHLPVSYNGINYNQNKKIKHLFISPGIRWWGWHGYSGIFTGVGLISGIYNAGLKQYRYSGSLNGVTLSCGYAFMLSRRVNLEAEAGAGIGKVKYDKFFIESCGEYAGSGNHIILYPSIASISIIYIIQ